jgi:uncharacterized protein YbjQ (UPF0145 family)
MLLTAVMPGNRYESFSVSSNNDGASVRRRSFDVRHPVSTCRSVADPYPSIDGHHRTGTVRLSYRPKYGCGPRYRRPVTERICHHRCDATIGASLQTILGGNITLLTQLCEKTRQDAFAMMMQHAAERGANAIISARYDANEVMQGVTEVLAYGTAVYVEKI